MFTVFCRHCRRIVIADVLRLVEHHYATMRTHLKSECPMIALDLTQTSISELLKHCVLTPAAE